jgi:hypothetical protein
MNRLPNVREVATKARLAFHLKRHAARLEKPLNCIPETHVVSARLQFGKERERLQCAAIQNEQGGMGTVWIVKPDNKNRGTDISVHASIGALHLALGGDARSAVALNSWIGSLTAGPVSYRYGFGSYQFARSNGFHLDPSEIH